MPKRPLDYVAEDNQTDLNGKIEGEEGDEEDGGSDSPVDGSSDNDDSSSGSSSDSSILKPPERRTLPIRVTRGRVKRRLDESSSSDDKEFWENDVWKEESDDDEWFTEDEGHYKDKFDSDFLDEDDDDQEEKTVEAQGLALDKAAIKLERKSQKKFDYQKITSARLKRKEENKFNRVWSALDVSTSSTSTARRKTWNWCQDDHLRQARICEKQTLDLLEQRSNQLENAIPTAVGSGNVGRCVSDNNENGIAKALGGQVELFVSWSSERKIEGEELKKSAWQKSLEAENRPYERQLLFFINKTDPKSSKISDYYKSSVCRNVHTQETPAKDYCDPETMTKFKTIDEFQQLRQDHYMTESNELLFMLNCNKKS